MLDYPIAKKNEKYIFEFSKRLSKFTNDEIDFKIIWSTRNIKSLFPLKDKITYKSNVIYEGKCTCGGVYIGETKRNAETRWSEHSPASGKSEPAKHIRNYHDHEIKWKVLTIAPRNCNKRKILEAFYININKPSLNNQLETKSLRLFRNGIT